MYSTIMAQIIDLLHCRQIWVDVQICQNAAILPMKFSSMDAK